MLLLNQDNANEVQVDLMSILGPKNNGPFNSTDTGVTDTIGNPTYQVEYPVALSSSFIANRIIGLVQSPVKTIVSGVASDFMLSSGPITNFGGAHFGPGSFPTGPGGAAEIWTFIFYDIGDCNKSQYHVYDKENKQILMPRVAILFHELCHAWHIQAGNARPTVDGQEEQAINDENAGRQELLGPSAELRDPKNYNGGCGYTPATNQGDPWGNMKCYVASAALDHSPPAAAMLRELLLFRDTQLRRTKAGSEFFVRLWEEYYQFSPTVGRILREDKTHRFVVRELFVLPLLRVIAFLKQYWVTGKSSDLSSSELRESGEIALKFGGIAAVRIAAQFLIEPIRSNPAILHGELKRTTQMLSQLLQAVGETEVSVWALLRPVDIYWSWVETYARYREVPQEQMLTRLTQWLHSAPECVRSLVHDAVSHLPPVPHEA